MNWFKNLNATPRLMISFGAMIVLTLTMGLLGLDGLSKANDRVRQLDMQDMKGALLTDDIAIARTEIGRQNRDAVLKIDNPAVVADDEKIVQGDFAKIHADLDQAEKLFVNPEGIATIRAVRESLPPFEKAFQDLYERLHANDLAGAKTALEAVSTASVPVNQAADHAKQIKAARADAALAENSASYNASRTLMITACVVSLILGVILALIIARSFSRPLAQSVETLEKVAGGDLTAALDIDTRDEIGRMAAALNSAVQRLNQTMQQVAASAADTSSSSKQLSSASESIASGAQEQAASLEETSASLEQITATVRNTADNARQASQLAAASASSAQDGQNVVVKAIAAMTEIDAASQKISDIISTIDEIAFQTNLLAVNAAVEAARAGEEGRGFAVVASEVRSLAQRSAVAAKEIKGLIQDSVRKVEAGSSLVNESGKTLQGIVSSVKRVTDIVGEIAAAAAEQSSGIEQVNSAMMQMDQVTQSNSAQTEELSATAESLSDQAGHLLELINRFQLGAQEDKLGSQSIRRARVEPKAPAAPVVKAKAFAAKPKAKASRPAQAPAFAHAVAVPAGALDASFEEF